MHAVVAIRRWTTHYYRGASLIVSEALLWNGTVIPWRGEIPLGLPFTVGCREANGRAYGGGEFADILEWHYNVPLAKIASTLRRLQLAKR